MKKIKVFIILIVILILSFLIPFKTEVYGAKTLYKDYYNIYGFKIYSTLVNL